MISRLLRLLRLLRSPRNMGDSPTPNPADMRAFYSQFMREGDLCFDVGANVGNRTHGFVELGARVVAVEPQEACVQRLRDKYHSTDRVTIVQKALGEQQGQAGLLLSNAHAISSLSKEWIKAVKRSGRFSAYNWDTTVTVPITTLDNLIEEYGRPVFCKIDVEGYEFKVLEGLSQPIDNISFEFTPEFLDAAISCIRILCSIGTFRFNYSVGESMRLALPNWVGPEQMCHVLASLPDKTIFGDVYARLIDQDS